MLASGDGCVDAGFSPVKLSLKAVATVDLMVLEDKRTNIYALARATQAA
jgi:hypothetical protein